MKKNGKCDNCGRIVNYKETLYEIRIDIYAKGGPIEITKEDLDKDHIAEMKKLIDAMEKMDEQELTDEVWESYRFDLCHDCRKEFHANLKLKAMGSAPQSYRHRIENS
jgi:benzoyl-CoA reductase/2-hydroxyglutaryl-CoA dehydratase subunit BcrC/BadD/HgdB